MNDPTPTRRRFYPTPAWLIFALLAAEGLLWLSERYTWFWFNEKKGWTVLIGVAVVGVAMLLMVLWFFASLLFRWRFQFSIRSLLILTVAVAIPCSWLAVEMRAAERQREAIAKCTTANQSESLYDYEADGSGEWLQSGKVPPGTEWLRSMLGTDFFCEVASISVSNDNELENLKAFPALRALCQYGSDVTDDGRTHLADVSHLKGLRLDSTQITDSGFQHLSRLSELEWLSLRNTRISDTGLRHLAGLARLQWLDLGDLDGTQISNAGVRHLAGLSQLKTLILSNAQITDDGLQHLAGLSQLEELYLNGTRISDAGLKHLGGLTQLRDMVLDGDTRITDAAVEDLAKLKRLNRLSLTGTQVSDDGVAKLQQALPGCEVSGTAR